MISANAVDAYESRANDGSGGAGGVGEGRRRGNAITCATCFAPRARRRAPFALARSGVGDPDWRGVVMASPSRENRGESRRISL